MTMKSTSTTYGSVAIAIHWTSAAAVILTFVAGLVMANSETVATPLRSRVEPRSPGRLTGGPSPKVDSRDALERFLDPLLDKGDRT